MKNLSGKILDENFDFKKIENCVLSIKGKNQKFSHDIIKFIGIKEDKILIEDLNDGGISGEIKAINKKDFLEEKNTICFIESYLDYLNNFDF